MAKPKTRKNFTRYWWANPGKAMVRDTVMSAGQNLLIGDYRADPGSAWMRIERKYPSEFFDPRDVDHAEASVTTTEAAFVAGLVLLLSPLVYMLFSNRQP